MEFWQQNPLTKFLVKSFLLTAPFLSSRKQYESFSLKHHYHQLLQRWGSTNYGYGSDVPSKHSRSPPPPLLPHSHTCRIYLDSLPPPLAIVCKGIPVAPFLRYPPLTQLAPRFKNLCFPSSLFCSTPF